jgi:hypothetical protein
VTILSGIFLIQGKETLDLGCFRQVTQKIQEGTCAKHPRNCIKSQAGLPFEICNSVGLVIVTHTQGHIACLKSAFHVKIG